MLQNTGEVAEWFKAHAWKVCVRQKRIGGSNPFLSAFLEINDNKNSQKTKYELKFKLAHEKSNRFFIVS